MAQFIHAKRTPQGYRYRLWSTVDDYLTSELDASELRRYCLGQELADAADRFAREWPERVARAEDRGTSALSGSQCRRDVDGPWEEPK